MNADQYRNLPSWVSRSELCRVAGLSPNAIRMRVERGRELSESQQEALDAAVNALTRAVVCKAVVEALETLESSIHAYFEGGQTIASAEVVAQAGKTARDTLADWKARVGE